MKFDRITHQLRSARSHAIGKVIVGAAGAAISVGLAASAAAGPVPQPSVPDFLAAYHDLCPSPRGSYDYWAYSTS